jgi:hypothetical protein
MTRRKLASLFRRRKAERDEDYDRVEDERLKAEFTGSMARTRDYMGIGIRRDSGSDGPRH